MHFQHSADIWRDFPALAAGVVYAEGITGDAEGSRPARIDNTARDRLAEGPECEYAEIRAWRRAFAEAGPEADPVPLRGRIAAAPLPQGGQPAAAAPAGRPVQRRLAGLRHPGRRLRRQGGSPGRWRCRYARGDEDYLTFGGETEHPAPGEVIFADQAGQAHARRWTNRQSGRSAVRDTTGAVLIVAEALHNGAASDVPELTATLAAEIGATWPCRPPRTPS